MAERQVSDSEREDFGVNKLQSAIEAFVDTAAAVADSLRDLPIAVKVVKWLDENPEAYADNLTSELDACNEDPDEMLRVIEEDFKDEPVEDLEELLETTKDVSNLVDDVLAGRASDDLADELGDYIQAKVEPFNEAGWHLYSVLLGAV